MAGMTSLEYADAVRRAHTQCAQETAAARAEYDRARQEIAAVRKARAAAARARRDQQIQDLREQFARERAEGRQ